jgi:hypothetical protein
LGRVGFGGAAVPAAWGCRALRGIRLGLGTARAARGALAWARPGGWAGAGRQVEGAAGGGGGLGWLETDASAGRKTGFPRSVHGTTPSRSPRGITIGRRWETVALFARQKSILAVHIYLIERGHWSE